LFLGREKGRTIGRGKGRAKGTIKGRVDWRAVIEGFIIVLHGCIQTPILLPPGRISVGSDFQKIKVASAMGLRGAVFEWALGDGCLGLRPMTIFVFYIIGICTLMTPQQLSKTV
jgi:hypothetical protein